MSSREITKTAAATLCTTWGLRDALLISTSSKASSGNCKSCSFAQAGSPTPRLARKIKKEV